MPGEGVAISSGALGLLLIDGGCRANRRCSLIQGVLGS
jgi:hypothetical protein